MSSHPLHPQAPFCFLDKHIFVGTSFPNAKILKIKIQNKQGRDILLGSLDLQKYTD